MTSHLVGIRTFAAKPDPCLVTRSRSGGTACGEPQKITGWSGLAVARTNVELEQPSAFRAEPEAVGGAREVGTAMGSLTLAAIAFAVVFVGGAIGLELQRRLPESFYDERPEGHDRRLLLD